MTLEALKHELDLLWSPAVQGEAPLAGSEAVLADSGGNGATAVRAEDGPTVGDVEAGLEVVSRDLADVAVQPLGSHGAGLTCYLT